MEVEEELQLEPPTSKANEASASAVDSNDEEEEEEGGIIRFQPFSRGAFKDRPRKKSFTTGRSDEGGEVAEIQEGQGEIVKSGAGTKKRKPSSDSEDYDVNVSSFLTCLVSRDTLSVGIADDLPFFISRTRASLPLPPPTFPLPPFHRRRQNRDANLLHRASPSPATNVDEGLFFPRVLRPLASIVDSDSVRAVSSRGEFSCFATKSR